MVSNTRLYGAAIALVSGVYSLWSVSTAAEIVPSAWIMLVVGVVVVIHGAVLLTPYADRLGDASGPLMIGYAIVMLLNQVLLATGTLDDGRGMTDGGMMNGGMGGMDGSGMTAGMGWDAGMVVIAVLMLASGVIMTQNRSTMSDDDRM